MTEILKREMLQVQEERSLDALYGVMPSQYQPSTEMATVGPYNLANLYSSSVTSFISDPRLSSVVLCGRNELKRGNLPSVLKYVLASTGSVRNIVYADGNSTDGSAIYMEAMGITTLRRTDLLDLLDKRRFAEVLAVSEKTIEGQDVPGEIPLRKGLEVLNVQQFFLQKYLQAKSPRYLLYIDT